MATRQQDIRAMFAPGQGFPRFAPLQAQANLPFQVVPKQDNGSVFYDDENDKNLKFKWTGDYELVLYIKAGDWFEIGRMELESQAHGNRVWLDHIEVNPNYRRRGLGIMMIHIAALRFGPALRLPGLGVSGQHSYYWYDDDGRRLGASVVRRNIITHAQHNDPDIPAA